MCEIIDFLSIKGRILQREADRCAGLSRHLAARASSLQRTDATLADQVRVSLDAAKAEGDHRRAQRALASLQARAPAKPPG